MSAPLMIRIARMMWIPVRAGAGRVSQYFEVGQETVWNPSNGVGVLFVRSSEALGLVVDVPTGVAASGAEPRPGASDVQVSSEGFAARAEPGRLEELRLAHAKAMPH